MIKYYDAEGRQISEEPALRYKRFSMTAAANHKQMDKQRRVNPAIVKAVIDGISQPFLFDAGGCSYSTLRFEKTVLQVVK